MKVNNWKWDNGRNTPPPKRGGGCLGIVVKSAVVPALLMAVARKRTR